MSKQQSNVKRARRGPRNVPPMKTCAAWSRMLNDWYGIDADADEVMASFIATFADRKFDGRQYCDVFLKHGGHWRLESMDTYDREELADGIVMLRDQVAAIPPLMKTGWCKR